MHIKEIMKGQPHTCGVAQTLNDAAAQQIRRLPVVDEGGRPVGFVSLQDLAQRLGPQKVDVSAVEIAETLRGITRPRDRAEAASKAISRRARKTKK